jgi:ribulose kinase
MCIDLDSSFCSIIEQCEDINPYGVITRYPKEREITVKMAQIAINQAQKIYAFCLSKKTQLGG